MSEFMDRAKAEAEKEWRVFGTTTLGNYRMHEAFGRGALWASEQEPTDEEVEAVAEVIYLRMPRSGDEDYADLPEAWKKVYRDHARATLLAVQKVRTGQ